MPNNERVIKVLAYYYKMIMKLKFFLEIWLEISDIVIKKGKNLALEKLQVIQLAGADLKQEMRIVVGNRNKVSIESDDRSSKSNHVSRPIHSAYDSILKKILVLGDNLVTGKYATHAMKTWQNNVILNWLKLGQLRKI